MKQFLLFLSLLGAIISIAQTEDVWDTYIADYSGKPGSTMLNMSLVNAAPIKDLSYALITGVTFNDCTKDGFPVKNIIDSLYALEEAVIDLVNRNKAFKHAGSFTSQCQRLNYFYIGDTTGIRLLLANLYKTRFPHYLPYINIKPDSQWNGYLKFLYPNEETREDMSNSKMVQKLSDAGDALDKPRQVDHWLYFKTAADRTTFIEYTNKNKFKVTGTQLLKDAPLKYQLKISRVDKVDIVSINKITIALNKEAKKLGGSYDGWETIVVK